MNDDGGGRAITNKPNVLGDHSKPAFKSVKIRNFKVPLGFTANSLHWWLFAGASAAK